MPTRSRGGEDEAMKRSYLHRRKAANTAGSFALGLLAITLIICDAQAQTDAQIDYFEKQIQNDSPCGHREAQSMINGHANLDNLSDTRMVGWNREQLAVRCEGTAWLDLRVGTCKGILTYTLRFSLDEQKKMWKAYVDNDWLFVPFSRKICPSVNNNGPILSY